jgi:hypothetical protein
MQLVIAALVVLSLLGLLNLLLTVGIIRRMRADAGTKGAASSSGLRPGSAVGEFAVTTINGEPITDKTVTGTVAFFSAGCEACHDLLPDFLAYARDQGRDNVVAVVGGDDPTTVSTLEGVARVVTAEITGGPVAAAFRNTWTPALYVVSGRHVIATAARVADLPRRPASSRS